MSILDRLTTKHRFADGAKMSVLHRYALRLEIGGRVVDFGFEQALEPGVDRLIHEGSILKWVGPSGEMIVTPAERAAVVAKAEEYCRVKGLAYRVVRDVSAT
jgi:hypothetical protein